jgi:hypothetical protein
MPAPFTPVTATTGLAEHADGRPIACTDATAVVVFVYQDPAGAYVVDIHTRDPAADGRLRVLLDQLPLLTAARPPRPRASRREAGR